MNTINVTRTAIINFANDHADVMRMVREESGFHLGTINGKSDTPRALLHRYVRGCAMMGVKPYNDAWLAYAETVVDKLVAREAAAVRALRDRNQPRPMEEVVGPDENIGS